MLHLINICFLGAYFLIPTKNFEKITDHEKKNENFDQTDSKKEANYTILILDLNIFPKSLNGRTLVIPKHIVRLPRPKLLKNHNSVDTLNTSQHTTSGHCRPPAKDHSNEVFAGGLIVACFDMPTGIILSFVITKHDRMMTIF